MSDKTAKELTDEFTEKYKAVRPALDALNERLRDIKKYFVTFRSDNAFWNSRFNWLADFNLGIGPNEIDDECFGFEEVNYNGSWENFTLMFDEFDNFESILAAEFAEYNANKEKEEVDTKEKRIAALKASRDAADAELARLVS